MFKSPIFFISPGERRGLSNLSLNIFDTSNKFKDLLLFFKQQGIIETPEINIYLKDHGDRSSRNVDYDISKSLSVIKKILSYDFDCKIKIFSTESLYSTYISDIFTEDELEKMSVSVFSDDEFEYPKDREVSDFSVKKIVVFKFARTFLDFRNLKIKRTFSGSFLYLFKYFPDPTVIIS